MPSYSDEFKASMVKKMLPPSSISISTLAKESGVTDKTLYRWRQDAVVDEVSAPESKKKPHQWRAEEKFAVVLETASLNELQLSEYCRKKGLFPELISEWREVCMQANDNAEKHRVALTEQNKQSQRRIKELERELLRKDKALAETAALLVLSKKAQAIWGASEDE